MKCGLKTFLILQYLFCHFRGLIWCQQPDEDCAHHWGMPPYPSCSATMLCCFPKNITTMCQRRRSFSSTAWLFSCSCPARNYHILLLDSQCLARRHTQSECASKVCRSYPSVVMCAGCLYCHNYFVRTFVFFLQNFFDHFPSRLRLGPRKVHCLKGIPIKFWQTPWSYEACLQ